MACFILPSPHFLSMPNVTLVPRVLVGYYPPTQTTLAAAPFPRTQGPPAITQAATSLTLSPGGAIRHPLTTGPRPPRPCFQRPFQRGSYKGNGYKGVKRKRSESENSDEHSPDSTSSHPLYCGICKVTLNAAAQAKQHYEGKNHAKRMKMYTDGVSTNGTAKTDKDDSSTEKLSSAVNGTVVVQSSDDINPEIYCKYCGVSFNSPKQAHQHYQGKNHAKRMRSTNSKAPINPITKDNSNNATKSGSKFYCSVCGIQLSSQEQYNKHVLSSRHITASKGQLEKDKSGGRWGGAKRSGSGFHNVSPGGIHMYGEERTENFSTTQKRVKRDFSMFRTPSGKYYCSCCNVTFSSDIQFAQHVDSKKHKMNNALQKTTDSLDS